MMKYPLFFIALLFPVLSFASNINIHGSIVSSAANKALSGVKVSLMEPFGFSSSITSTDHQGRFKLDLVRPQTLNLHSRFITLRFEKNGYQKSDQLHSCDLKTQNQCDIETIELYQLKQPTTLSQNEQEMLTNYTGNQGNSLFLIPYRMLPDDAPVQIDVELFVFALQSAINTRMQNLEEFLGVQAFEPLPPIELQTLTETISRMSLGKRRSIGEYVTALAMISGMSQWKSNQGDNQQMSIYSNFLVMPTETGKNPRLLQVRDKGLSSEAVNSIELADQLSPLWGHFALLAIAGKEYARAAENGDKAVLERIRAYLIAEKATLQKEETFKLNDLNRLLAKIEGGLNQ